MPHYVLIACVALKAQTPAPARDLYQSPLFRKAIRYAEQLRPDRIFILSAKYGLVPSEQRIEPYNETLNDKSVAEIRAWADKVVRDLREHADLDRDRFTILAGQNYRRFLMPHLRNVEIPLEGLPIGKQLQALDRLSA